MLYAVCGNFTGVPKDLLPSSPHRNYADDLAIKRIEDGNGFGAGHGPPGGYVVRMDLDGKNAELFAAGQRNTPAVERAVAYLVTQRNADGGFPYSQASEYGTASDANSTALVIQAIVAAGGNPTAGPWADVNGNPVAALLAQGAAVQVGSRHPERLDRRLPAAALECPRRRVRFERLLAADLLDPAQVGDGLPEASGVHGVESQAQVRGGRLRGLAVTTPKRIAAIPDLPAVAEALPGSVARSPVSQ